MSLATLNTSTGKGQTSASTQWHRDSREKALLLCCNTETTAGMGKEGKRQREAEAHMAHTSYAGKPSMRAIVSSYSGLQDKRGGRERKKHTNKSHCTQKTPHSFLCSTFVWTQTATQSVLQKISHILSVRNPREFRSSSFFKRCFFFTLYPGWSHVLVAVSTPECTWGQISYGGALGFTIEDVKQNNKGIVHSC